MNSTIKQLTCIVCPIGCRISVDKQNMQSNQEIQDDQDCRFVFSGNRCDRGADFAAKEMTAPTRSLATTVRTVFPEMPVLSVRTNGEIRKEKIPEIIRELAQVIITKKIGIGEIVVADIAGTDCDIIATSTMRDRY